MAGEPSGARYLSHVMFRAEEVNFNRFPGAIMIIVFSLVISSGSAFADGKADVVAAVNWFLDKLGCDTLGEGLDHRRIPASRVARADGVHYWWKVLSYLTFVRICSII